MPGSGLYPETELPVSAELNTIIVFKHLVVPKDESCETWSRSILCMW